MERVWEVAFGIKHGQSGYQVGYAMENAVSYWKKRGT